MTRGGRRCGAADEDASASGPSRAQSVVAVGAETRDQNRFRKPMASRSLPRNSGTGASDYAIATPHGLPSARACNSVPNEEAWDVCLR